MRNTMRKVMMVATVLISRSQISENPKTAPSPAHVTTTAVAVRKAQREPTALAMVLANFRNRFMRGLSPRGDLPVSLLPEFTAGVNPYAPQMLRALQVRTPALQVSVERGTGLVCAVRRKRIVLD